MCVAIINARRYGWGQRGGDAEFERNGTDTNESTASIRVYLGRKFLCLECTQVLLPEGLLRYLAAVGTADWDGDEMME